MEKEKQNIIDKVLNIIREEMYINCDNVTVESKFHDDLGFDSLDCVEFIIAIEDEFFISIPDEEAENFYNKTVGQFCDLIEFKVNKSKT
jgi:acyl carrier protein